MNGMAHWRNKIKKKTDDIAEPLGKSSWYTSCTGRSKSKNETCRVPLVAKCLKYDFSKLIFFEAAWQVVIQVHECIYEHFRTSRIKYFLFENIFAINVDLTRLLLQTKWTALKNIIQLLLCPLAHFMSFNACINPVKGNIFANI